MGRSVAVTVVPILVLSLVSLSGCAISHPDNQVPGVTANSGNLTAVSSVPPLVGQRTQLPVPEFTPRPPYDDPMPLLGVSPDGQWILGRSSNASAPNYIESVDGKKVSLPSTWDMVAIYGQTHNGDLIFGYTAGGGGAKAVFSPQHGIVQTFPFNNDKNSHWTYVAIQSTRGDWITEEANSNGAGPGQKVWWDINGRPVPLLSDASGVLWTSQGDELVITKALSSSKTQLALYDLKSGNETPLTSTLSFPDPSIVAQSPVPDRAAAIWPPDGHYLAYHTMDALVVLDMDTHKQMQLASSTAGLNWEFVSPSEIAVLDNNSPVMHFYQITNDKLTLMTSVTLPSVADYEAIGSGRILVQESSGQMDVVSASGRQVIIPTPVTLESWWYNRVNHQLYYQPSNNGSPVQQIWTVPVPKA